MDEASSPEPVAPADRSRLRRHLSPPMVVSTLALFVALGGTGYAAVKLPKNSVGPRQIKDAAVTSSKVKNGSLLARDFRKGEVPAGKTGAVGPAGPQGPVGAQGPQGATGSFPFVVTRSVQTTVTRNLTLSVIARCSVGEVAVGGGGTFAGGSAEGTSLQRSAPTRILRDAAGNPTGDTVPDGPSSADGWTVTGTNASTGPDTGSRILRAFVLCVPAP